MLQFILAENHAKISRNKLKMLGPKVSNILITPRVYNSKYAKHQSVKIVLVVS